MGKNHSELAIERIFEAPRERVWQAWTNPEQLKRWWGPQDFTAPYAEILEGAREGWNQSFDKLAATLK